MSDRVADLHVVDRLDVADEIPDLSRREFLHRHHVRSELAELEDFVGFVGSEHADAIALFHSAIHDADVDDDPPIVVEHRIEDQGLQFRFRIAAWRRNALDDTVQ